MRIEVVNTGTELLLGKVVNTHAAYFGQELFKLGLRLRRQITIPDGDEIREALDESFPRSDVILITGGLGPTDDDVTREVVAARLGRVLHRDDGIRESIRELFRSRGLRYSELNDRQAMVPEGAVVLENPNGTAPGLFVPAVDEPRSPHLFLLPGPPRELKPMFRDQVAPRLVDWRSDEEPLTIWHNFRIYGAGESAIASRLQAEFDAIDGLEVGYCARLGEVDLRLIGGRDCVERAAALVRDAFHREIMTESEDAIEKVILDLLVERKETVATAESCTGGNIAHTITNAPGASAVFHRGYVTYSNESKTDILGVPGEVLAAHGAVSAEAVRAMAGGCLERSGADHAVAVSGIAGPSGGSEEKPAGTVFVGIASRHEPLFAKRYFLPYERLAFKERVTRLVLDLLRQRLRGFALD